MRILLRGGAPVLALLALLGRGHALVVGVVTSDAGLDASLGPEEYRRRTLAQFREDAFSARNASAELVVYPEFAFVSRAWSKTCTTAQGTTDWCPPFPRNTTCDGTLNVSYSSFSAALACTARDANTTLSFNVCEGDGTSNWNSQVVYLPNGTMKALYRKTHPYMKKCYAAPKTPDLVYFSSAYLPLPAGERIGVFTCKDILFKHPSSDLYSMGARLFIYSSDSNGGAHCQRP